MPPTRLQKTKRERTAINVDIKKEICKYMLANTDIKYADVTLFFNTKYKLDIDRSTITKIWQNREKWLTALSNSNIFCCHSVQFPELDKALQIWTSQAVAAGLPLTNTILQQKELELAQMLNITAYNEEDIYNADETELFFQMESDQTLGTDATAGHKKIG
ncbi:tigger transposable element-derived protein 6-like [Rhizophagus irregularis DAOM 181602=DAOM 197198]|nr:tigger transposable element-derived protein 6-like [Rhizophagus irregularis DAOM 181602=DAOM 197198]